MVRTHIEYSWTAAFDISSFDSCRTPQMCSSLHKLIMFQLPSNVLQSIFARGGVENVVVLRCFVKVAQRSSVH